MEPSRIADEVVVLQATCARLEAVLEQDEHWRALMRGPRAEEDAAARRARDTRLEMALADNAVYRAWRHVSEAIAALRDQAAGVRLDATDPAGAVGPPAHRSAASELPRDIAKLIRDRSAEEARSALAGAHGQSSGPSPVTSRTESAPDRGGVLRPVAPPPATDWQEAAVTFITREQNPAPPPSAELPAARRPPLRDRLRGVTAEPEAPSRAFSPAQGQGDEAAVTILTEKAIKERARAEQRAGAIARFRKTLLGE